MNPFKQIALMDAVHANAPLERNFEIMFGGSHVGELDFVPLYRECLETTGTTVDGWKTFRRAQRALNLARYFHYALALPGEKVECGVLKGFSALLLCRVARMRDPDFRGGGLHLVDSFEGLSKPAEPDAVAARENAHGTKELVYSHSAGHFATPVDHVRRSLASFPAASIHRGWIPDVLGSLPETTWSFVHIDVDLFEPTLGCLEYFVPRLEAGGVIVNDDFDSPLFPGAKIAWHQFCQQRDPPYVVLDTGQAVFMRDRL